MQVVYKYRVKLYKDDYHERQAAANRDGAVCYVEQHFNSFRDPRAGYTVTLVASNASAKSRSWGKWYSKRISLEFATRLGGSGGLKVLTDSDPGNNNLVHTHMPAILLEPLFVSNQEHAKIVKSEVGQIALARSLVDSILWAFPDGGSIAFSVGHKYKKSDPDDRGAAVAGGGWEAEYAEIVMLKAKRFLEDYGAILSSKE